VFMHLSSVSWEKVIALILAEFNYIIDPALSERDKSGDMSYVRAARPSMAVTAKPVANIPAQPTRHEAVT